MPISIYCQNYICISFIPYYLTNRDKYCETPENPRFWIKGKIVISDENPEFF